MTGVSAAPSVQTGVLLSADEYAQFQLADAPFDPAVAAGYFAYALVGVIASWLIGLAVGLILRTVREA